MVEHLEAVAFEHRDLAAARVVREADHLLGGDLARVDRDVHPAALVDRDRGRIVRQRDRRPDAVGLATIAPNRFLGSSFMAKTVAVERPIRSCSRNSRSNAPAWNTRAAGSALAAACARLASASVTHADPALEQDTRDRRPHAPGTEDHDVVDPLLAVGDDAAPGAGRAR